MYSLTLGISNLNILIFLQIEQDFEVLHNSASNKLYEKWNNTASKLIQWCPKVAPYAFKNLKTGIAGEVDLEIDELNEGNCILFSIKS